MPRWFHLAQLAGDRRIQRSAPDLASAVTKLLASIDFGTPTTLQPDEARALVKYIHGYIQADQAQKERERQRRQG